MGGESEKEKKRGRQAQATQMRGEMTGYEALGSVPSTVNKGANYKA